MNETQRARTVFTEMQKRSNGKLFLTKIEGRGSMKGLPDYMGVWDGESVVLEDKIQGPRWDSSEALQNVYLERHGLAGGLSVKVEFDEKKRWVTLTTMRKDALRKCLQNLQCEIDAVLPRGWNVSIKFVERFVTLESLKTKERG